MLFESIFSFLNKGTLIFTPFDAVSLERHTFSLFDVHMRLFVFHVLDVQHIVHHIIMAETVGYFNLARSKLMQIISRFSLPSIVFFLFDTFLIDFVIHIVSFTYLLQYFTFAVLSTTFFIYSFIFA